MSTQNNHKTSAICSLAQLPLMLTLAEISAQFVAAERARRVAQANYHDTIQEYESRHGQLGTRLNPDNPQHAGVIAYSAESHAQHVAAKRHVYNLKRRMETAVRRIETSTTNCA